MARQSASAKTIARGAARISKRLIFSYVFDWICIIIIAALGGIFNTVIKNTSHRAFVLQDPSISYPYQSDTVSPTVLILVGLVAPAIITFVVSFVFVPGGGAPPGTPKALIWRRKLWEWNTAWMGLGLALASAFMATEGLKDLAGKPRPHMLALCKPNLDQISRYQVGGLGTQLNGGAVPIMVDYGICEETDAHALRNMFASWPSGHSSFSWAGLLYLSLWAASKFAVTVPYLYPSLTNSQGRIVSTFDPDVRAGDRASGSTEHLDENHPDLVVTNHGNPPRNQAAAPPVYLLMLIFFPPCTALFIAVSRWFDYHHHGFDIISGSLLGAFTAFFSFRFYHMPIRRGSGWSWGARTRDRAFWLGVGRDTYVGEEGWISKKDNVRIVREQRDVDVGKHAGKPGTAHSDEGDLPTTSGPSAV